jgi:NAD(P)-dependent dehydrogenase (short-subunit alcohol dehydrogenase family)
MQLKGNSLLVTGGASGLGRAVATRAIAEGGYVTIVDLPTSAGVEVAASLGAAAQFVAADVRHAEQMSAAVDAAAGVAPLRVLVHCAGRGQAVRVVDRDGQPGSLETFSDIITLNLIGTFNVLRLAAAKMATNEQVEGERGVCVLTASIAAFEGQIRQVPYASSKAGVVGMTLVAARDLASKFIRVVTIAPGTFDTPILARLSDEVRESLGKMTPHPARLGRPEEFANLVSQIISNPMLNGETIRLDGAIRMAPR